MIMHGAAFSEQHNDFMFIDLIFNKSATFTSKSDVYNVRKQCFNA
jgi:hypothetical protein